MCGLAGWMGGARVDDAESAARRMADALAHRGPDDAGTWIERSDNVALAHRRLAVLDLSRAGHQPMESACGRFVIVFNGEIYNHLEVRQELEAGDAGAKWRGHSDTETLLAAIAAWGPERALQSSTGMFALAVWDRRDKVLTLARDRFGEKPLYFGWQRDTFVFASELKAIRTHPAFTGEVDRDALALLLRHNCIPAPHCIYKGLYKLGPGEILSVPLSHEPGIGNVVRRKYWSVNEAVANGLADPLAMPDDEAVDELERLLGASVERQMLSDVPLGAFLSGGIDSSLIVAAMQASSARPVNTFSIGFDDATYDEAQDAAAVARHLGTAHTELCVTSREALDVIPLLPRIYCEPFADSSQVPTYLVSQLASQHVTVALSGDAGDEVFGGYNRYAMAHSVWVRSRKLPRPVRRGLAGLLTSLSPQRWDALAGGVASVLPGRLRLRMPGEKAHKLAGALLAEDGRSYYRHLVSHWPSPADAVIGASEPQTLLTDPDRWPAADHLVDWMMAMDAQTYLPDDILVKVDRAAMANSLETRVPFLDHRLFEFAWRLPRHQKIRDGSGKWLLRQLLARQLPEAVLDKPKMGFGIPLHDWLRGPLRDWAEALLDEKRLREEGFFEPGPVRTLWDSHQAGRTNEQHALWDVLMFQAWLAEA